MPRKLAPQKLPDVTLDEIRQTAASEADRKAKDTAFIVKSDL